MLKKQVITVDGPAGAGKSTVSKSLAVRFSYIYLDTGALYRAFAYKAKKEGISPDDDEGLSLMGQRVDIRLETQGRGLISEARRGRNEPPPPEVAVFVDDEEVTDEIRTEKISILASTISARPCVRQILLALQREAAVHGGVVAEGRDMGTVVFPDADYKFFLDAAITERAKRRYLELAAKNGYCNYEQVEKDLIIRDKQDRERHLAPLIPAPDAVVIDSTGMTAGEVVDKMTEFISLKIPKSDGRAEQS
jgi:cytidylate kinase